MRAASVWGWVAFLGAVGVTLYATKLVGLDATFPHPSLRWWALAAVFFLAEAFPVHFDFRSETHSLSLSELGVVLGLFLATPTSLVLGLAAGAGLALVAVRRQRPLKVAFNIAQFTVSGGAAVIVFRSIVGLGDAHGPAGWAAAAAGAATFGVVSVLLVTVTITLVVGGPPLRELPRTVSLGLTASLASASLALAAVEMLEADARSVWLLVVPALCWAFAFRLYGSQRKRHEHVQFLYRTMRATQGASEFRGAVRELLVAARTMLSAERAEILLFGAPGDGALRSVMTSVDEVLMEPVVLSDAALAAIAVASGRESAVLLPRTRSSSPIDSYLSEHGIEDAVVTALRREDRPFGLLLVGNRTGDVSTFGGDDRTLFETFAAHAGVLLENDQVKEQLRYQAFHDVLTGLPNRALFTERVSEALAKNGATTVVLFVDLDDFKTINDTLGHNGGDELLVAVAERVRACLRPGDIAARLGGDEFAILLEQSSERDAEQIASRLVDAMRARFVLYGREASVHASIGIASGASGARTADELLTQADVAMYSAKAGGKQRYAVYEPRMHARIRGRHELAVALEHAVSRGEIHVHYQPIISLSDSRTVAFEALVRWRHPTRGLLQPAAFLPLAEERGLIVQIGRAVLAEACRQTVAWQDGRPELASLSVAVNLSPSELLAPELAAQVEDVLVQTGLAPESLVLEITESGAMSDLPAAVRALHTLRRLGVRLALDDFGTGHASLSHLRDFPIDTLKIAKPFIDRLERRQADVTFLDAILRLAATLELDVVAEGIERADQARVLRELECSLGQGYYYARPLAAADAEAHLMAGPGQRRARPIRAA
jgi:diguanylate cyclase (GGDEF)-like protein